MTTMRHTAPSLLVCATIALLSGAGCPAGPAHTPGGTGGGTDEHGALAEWTPALRKAWDARRATARWLREYLAAGLLAARAAEQAHVPEAERDTAVKRLGPERWRVFFGRDRSGQAFQVTRQLLVTGTSTRWEPLAKPIPLDPRLLAQVRAVQTVEQYMESRRPGWRSRRQTQDHVLYNPFVRRVAGGAIQVWLIPFSSDPQVLVLGGDYRVRVSPDGRKVLAFRSLHRGLVRIRRPATRPPRAVVLNHVHRGAEGDLPRASDLLKIATSPHLSGLAVIGPHYTVLTGMVSGPKGWLGRLYHSPRFRRLIDPGR